MAWTVTPLMLVVFGSGLIGLFVGVVSLRQRPDPMAGPLAALLFSVAGWALPHAMSLGYADLESVLFWRRLGYLGVVGAPVAYLVVALTYAGYERWLSRRTYAALLVVPVITVAVVSTAPGHGLFWRSPAIVDVAGASIFVFERGPWYWVNLVYAYLVTAAGLLLFVSVVVQSGPIYRKQAGLMFVGGLVPLVTNVITLFAVPDPAIDFTTTALAVTGVTFALALFYLDLLEVRPVARTQLVEELDDGVVVIGPEGRVRDFNPTAERIVDGLAIDTQAEAMFPDGTIADGSELAVEIDGRERLFRPRSTALSDANGRETGRIIYFNEVTEIVEREQRISVLNRVLRHNVRNELNVAAGHLDVLADRVPDADRDHVETAAKSVDRVTSFADRARDLERTLRDAGDGRVVSVAAVTERVVADARERFPDAVIEYDGPEESLPDDPSGGDAPAGDSSGGTSPGDDDPAGDTPRAQVRVVEESFLEMALSELVENGVVHNDGDQPRVTVGVEPGPGTVRIRIADDGPGIPEAEREALGTRAETDLEHASGLGLWLVTWTASLSAGDVTFAENDPRGSVVTVSVPAADR